LLCKGLTHEFRFDLPDLKFLEILWVFLLLRSLMRNRVIGIRVDLQLE